MGLALVSRAVPFPAAVIAVEAAGPVPDLVGVGGRAPLPLLIAVDLDVGLGALADIFAGAVLFLLAAFLVVAASVRRGRCFPVDGLDGAEAVLGVGAVGGVAG